MLQCKTGILHRREDRARAVPGSNAFTGYGPGYIEVNGTRHTSSVVVSAERVEAWTARSVRDLARADFAALVDLAPEILLLGTGATFTFPEPAALADLHAARIGVEVMDTQAACRTYNILLGEGRNVVAALIV
jgi:uncharacterized protein